MFSKLRRSKSDKAPQPRQLSGMPALKQLRSSKRKETLSPRPKTANPVMTEFERFGITSTEREMTYIGPSSHPEVERPEEISPLNVSRNYRRPLSANVGELREQHKNVVNKVGNVNNIDRVRELQFNQRESVMYYDDILNGIPEDATEENREDQKQVKEEDPTSPVTPWKKNNGDSGYKSKDDQPMGEKKKRSRRRSSGQKQRGHGLHTMKQKRKASREESVSQSMRALTPKERESIQCLEEVLKNHPDGEESDDEVFDSDSSGDDFDEIIENSGVNPNLDETVDYGYASINDNFRKNSLESTSSVGSIIDLVGNLSGASNPTSPIYEPVDVTNENRNVTSDGFMYNNMNGFSHHNDETNTQEEDFLHSPEDALTHLDDVILSFSCNTGETYEDLDENGNKSGKENCIIEETNNNLEEKEKIEINVEKNIVKEKRRRKKSDSKEEGRDRERKKKKERRRKGEKSSKDRSERSHSREGSVKKEERSSKRREKSRSHSRKSSSSPAPDPAEPIYAQVRKPKKNKNAPPIDIKAAEEKQENDFPDPPSPFRNRINITEIDLMENNREESKAESSSDVQQIPTGRSSRLFWAQLERKQVQSPERKSTFIKSSPATPFDPRRSGHTFQTTSPAFKVASPTFKVTSPLCQLMTSTPKSTRPVSDVSQYATKFTPQSAISTPNVHRRIEVSENLLQDSSSGLRHVKKRSAKGMVLQVNPDKNKIERVEKQQGPVEVNETSCNTVSQPKPTEVETTEPSPIKHDINQNPVQLRRNVRAGRPVSLNLDQSGNLTALSTEKPNAVIIKPYSSFREGRNKLGKSNKQISKPRPFVIKAMNKPIKLY